MSRDEPNIQDILSNPNNLEYVIDYENIPKTVILQAVKKYPHALKYVDRDDREIVLTAVRSYGDTLQYASNRLKNDPEIVLAAIESRAFAIQHASKQLRMNKRFILNAIQKNPRVISYITDPDDDIILHFALQNDPIFIQDYQKALNPDSILSHINKEDYTYEDWDRAVQEIESEMIKRARQNTYKINFYF